MRHAPVNHKSHPGRLLLWFNAWRTAWRLRPARLRRPLRPSAAAHKHQRPWLGVPLAQPVAVAVLVVALVTPSPGHATESFVQVLAAELLVAQGQPAPALEVYRTEALSSKQPAVLERALSLANTAGDTALAQQLALHWTQVDPNHIPAKFYLAHLALVNHEYPLAADTLDQILRYDPNAALDRILAGIYPEKPEYRHQLLAAFSRLETREHPALLVLTAGLLAQDGQTDAALARIDRALRRRPNVTALITLKASVLQQQGRTDDVARWLTDQARRLPNNKALHLYWVRFLLKNQQSVQAHAQLTRMARRWPRDGEILLLAGLVCIDLKKNREAERYLLQLLPHDDFVDQAYYYLGINAERTGRIEPALAYLLKVEEPELYRKAQQKIVALRIAQGQLDAAINGLTQQRVDHPEQSDFLYLLQANVLRDHQQPEKARRLLDEAIAALADQPELLYLRVLLLRPEETAQRMADLNQLLALQPDNPIYLNAYAYALAEQGIRLDEARQRAEKANALSPEQASILDTLGFIALRQNRLADAQAWLQQAFALEQGLNTGLRLLEVLQQTGQTAAARALLADLHRLYPQDSRLPAPATLTSPAREPVLPAASLPVQAALP